MLSQNAVSALCIHCFQHLRDASDKTLDHQEKLRSNTQNQKDQERVQSNP